MSFYVPFTAFLIYNLLILNPLQIYNWAVTIKEHEELLKEKKMVKQVMLTLYGVFLMKTAYLKYIKTLDNQAVKYSFFLTLPKCKSRYYT